MPKIVVQIKDEPELHRELGECLSIGRSPDNGLALADSKVSRRHAEVRLVAPGRYRVSDLGSANGTWLNGRKLAVPRDLQNGDVIQIGSASLRFEMESAPIDDAPAGSEGTATQMAKECVVVLVTDVRNYTSMTESLPVDEFSRFIRDWFRECTRIIEGLGGIVDKFIGDAILCFWRVAEETNPADEINRALAAAFALMRASEQNSGRLSAIFPGHEFRIGIGLSMGNAVLGNVGTADNQSITIVGDSVNIAFRLEALTKQHGMDIIASSNLAPWARAEYKIKPLGDAEVKGRAKPVSICALIRDKSAGED